ncbi:fibrinogen C domain-containing protein 1-like [Mercenaria mercenaria]|uniref:fibrinogen C domain-containing protein 1-like n=1 Tax=Mercenaria mercenaria TaxID=6596 RepID=UPI001E1D375F|nr:fibrinogen C domain-containing protein 1-like [Mercenaria mercenaria]
MTCLELFSLVVCLSFVNSQTTVSGNVVSGSDANNIQGLKLMMQTLQTQTQVLQSQISAIHSTLLTQQTMSVDEICKIISNTQTNAANDPADCVDIKGAGHTKSGVYTVAPPGEARFQVYCDMETDGGGWLQIQKRQDGSVDFYKTYSEYETGFGNLTGEHYLGNRNIHAITKTGKYELLVELEDFQKHVKYAHYSSFSVGDAASDYRLSVDGYNGTAGDSLVFDHNGHGFSAHDADHDGAGKINCAEKHHGGYWYSACFKSNINGKWGVPGEQGIIWGSYKDWTLYVLRRTEMKIRRVK